AMSGPAWLILPTYDEIDNLEPIVRAALPVLERAAPGGHRLLIVDDASPHGTGELADRLAAELDAVRVLHRPRQGGLGRAGIADLSGGLKCFRRQVLEAIDLPSVRSHGYACQVELTYRAIRGGFEVVELPIVFRDRRAGTSKMSLRIAGEAMWLVPRMRLR